MLLKGRFQIMKGYQNTHVTIGFGSYGQVKLARDLMNGSVVAVKMINKIAKNEVAMHNKLIHPNIIKLIDVHIDTDRQITYMILEYADGGTLFQKIKMEQVPKKDIRKYFKDVCQALAYLHKQNIMHRDIKPENVLLTKAGQAKLCDFGFATLLGDRKTLCGTYQYMSPQMIQNRTYDNKIDIWALGILLFELIAGRAPFRGDKPQDVLEQMKTKIYFGQKFEPEDIDLIRMILRVTPQKRPTIEDILEQPFFKIQNNFDEKELTVESTINTEEYFIKISSMPHIGEGSIPKKMGDMNKMFQKVNQKQTYPPYYYVPKAHHKIGIGMAVASEKKQLTGSSSILEMKDKNISETMSIPLNHEKSTGRIGPGGNRCFSSLLFPNKTVVNQKILVNQQPQAYSTSRPINYLPIKPNLGFGRYS